MNFNSYSIADNALHMPIRPHKALIKSVKVILANFNVLILVCPQKPSLAHTRDTLSHSQSNILKLGFTVWNKWSLKFVLYKKTTKNNLRIILKKNSCSTTSVFSFFYSSILPQNGTQGGTRFSKMAPKTVQNRFSETIHPQMSYAHKIT